jgi:hypothetical protein
MAGKVGQNITVYTDYGNITGKVGGVITVTEQGVLEKRLEVEKATQMAQVLRDLSAEESQTGQIPAASPPRRSPCGLAPHHARCRGTRK